MKNCIVFLLFGIMYTVSADAESQSSNQVQCSIIRIVPPLFKVSWQGITGMNYQIEKKEVLSETWQHSSTEIADDGINRRTIVGENAGFFRILYVNRPDTNASSSTNLIFNGDFEIGSNSVPIGWSQGGYGDNNRTFEYPVNGYGSNSRAARLTVSNYVSGDGKWYFGDVPVTSGVAYRWSDMYMSSVPTHVTFRYLMTNGSYFYNGVLPLPSATAWSLAQYNFVAVTGAVSMTVFHAINMEGLLMIDNATLTRDFSGLDEGMVSIDLDDGLSPSTTNAASIIEENGYTGTFYLVSSRIGKPGVISTNTILELQAKGHEIGGHTINHLDLSTLDNDDTEIEINLGRSALLKLGAWPVTSFAYPFGSFNTNVVRMVKEAGFLCASTTDHGLITKGSANRFALNRLSIHSDTTLAYVKAQIDAALAQKKWLILLFHHVDDTSTYYSVSPEYFREIMEYLKSKNAKVVTASQGAELLRQ